jgi:plasmid stabilization system protein ParE
MAYKVVMLPKADDSMDAILAYLSQFYSGNGAAKFYEQFKKITTHLMDHPYMAPIDADHPPYRRLVIGQYLAYYQVDEEKKTVNIHRILRGSWNIRQI